MWWKYEDVSKKQFKNLFIYLYVYMCVWAGTYQGMSIKTQGQNVVVLSFHCKSLTKVN